VGLFSGSILTLRTGELDLILLDQKTPA